MVNLDRSKEAIFGKELWLFKNNSMMTYIAKISVDSSIVITDDFKGRVIWASTKIAGALPPSYDKDKRRILHHVSQDEVFYTEEEVFEKIKNKSLERKCIITTFQRYIN